MKKSFPVHIEGRIYYFDEDAYNRLNKYFDNLRQTFRSEDGNEIVTDIESRVSELIAEEYSTGPQSIVTIEQIDEIITRMGNPEELATDSEILDADEDRSTSSVPPPFPGPEPAVSVQKRLYRNVNDKVVAGVLSGLACYWGLSVTPLRIVFVILVLCTYFWPLVLLYIILWLVIPAAVTPRQILEMRGERVTVDNVGRTTILGTPDANSRTNGDFWSTFGRIVGVIIMSALGLFGLMMIISMIVVLILTLAGAVSFAGYDWASLVYEPTDSVARIICICSTCVAWLIPSIAAIWAACCVLFKTKGASKTTIIWLLIVEVVAIVTAVGLAEIY